MSRRLERLEGCRRTTFPHAVCNIIGTRMTGRSGVPIVLLITLFFGGFNTSHVLEITQ
jgi:hypothetical protein